MMEGQRDMARHQAKLNFEQGLIQMFLSLNQTMASMWKKFAENINRLVG
jgi:hypothetical protein